MGTLVGCNVVQSTVGLQISTDPGFIGTNNDEIDKCNVYQNDNHFYNPVQFSGPLQSFVWLPCGPLRFFADPCCLQRSLLWSFAVLCGPLRCLLWSFAVLCGPLRYLVRPVNPSHWT